MTLTKNDWRTTTASVWKCASAPLRAFYRRRDSLLGALPIPALFYHRVADSDPTPWTISRADFAAQIDWMAKRFEFLSLAELQRRVASRESFRPAVAITFDDGYRENLDFALPLLIERSIPVAYFVTAGNVLSGEPFPHDRALGLRLSPHTPDEIAALARHGVEIGVHTMTHRDLGQSLSEAELREEIVGARDALEAMVGSPLRYFAFPFGQTANVSQAAVEKVQEAGYAGWCSAFGGYNLPGRASRHLLRFHGDPSLSRLANWLTIDPRWRRSQSALSLYDEGCFDETDRHATALGKERQ